MHILFLTQVLPYPLDAGPKIRAYYTLRYLAQRHEVTLLSFVRPGDPPEAIEHLRGFCQAVHTVPMPRARTRDAWHLLRSLLTSTPFLIARDRVKDFGIRISEFGFRNLDFDFVHADQLWMAQYALLARNPQRCPEPVEGSAIRNPKLVLDQHNAVFQIPRRLAQHERNPLKRALLELEWRKLARYEAEICRQFDHVVWVTEEDRRAVNSYQLSVDSEQSDESSPPPVTRHSLSPLRNPQSAIRNTVIPICVDPQAKPVLPRRSDAHRVTFLGGMHWPPNAEGVLWFAREVWPRVQEAVPGAVFTIIGKNPPREFRILRLGSVQVSGFGLRNVEVTGYVEGLTPYLRETAVFIVPLHAGGGMRVKILDAWCWGLPVVSTTLGAEGIQVREGENMLAVAGLPTEPGTADAFAQAVVRVLREPELAARLAAGGRRTVEAHYDWREVYRAWDRVYGETR